MPQFDIISLGVQVFGLLISFLILYFYNMKNVTPDYIEVKKFRKRFINDKKKYMNSITFGNECWENILIYNPYLS